MKPIEQIKIHRTQELILDQEGNRSMRTHQSVELTREAVESGFLKSLQGSQLSVFLYLLTHIDHELTVTTNPTLIASLLPYTIQEIEKALKMLQVLEYIDFAKDENGEYHIQLCYGSTPTIPLEEIEQEPVRQIDIPEPPTSTEGVSLMHSGGNDAISYILRQKVFSEEDLVRAIALIIPAQNITYGFRQEVDYWFKTFDKEVVKELIRRTDEARQRDPEINCQAYIRKIAAEWMQEEIFTLADLETSDKLYRETRSLLEEYGIDRLKDTARTHWETVSRWVNSESEKDFALSVEVARYAIQTAIMRKSDGRPSLTYIEDNFIKPLKENQIKSVEEARELFHRTEKVQSKDKNPRQKPEPPKTKWQSGIDFTRFREN